MDALFQPLEVRRPRPSILRMLWTPIVRKLRHRLHVLDLLLLFFWKLFEAHSRLSCLT